MKSKLLHAILALSFLIAVPVTSNACNAPPEAIIIPPGPEWVHVNHSISLNGSNSTDDDGYIVEWKWDFNESDGVNWDNPDETGALVTTSYTDVDDYTVTLRVKDNGGLTATTTCTVYAVYWDVGMGPGEVPYVAVNNDDDNTDGDMDAYDSGTQTAEDDLVEIRLYVETPKTTDKVRLTAYGVYEPSLREFIKIWSHRDKQNQVIPDENNNYYREWSTVSFPDRLYVEGMWCASRIDDPWVILSYTGLDGLEEIPVSRNPMAKIEFTVVEVDVDMDGVKDVHYTYPHITEEIIPGGFIALNDDDDDDNGTPDKDEDGPVSGEDDLVKITLYQVSPTDLTGNVTLKKVPSDSTKIKIWENETKGGTPIILPATYSTPSDLPEELWVEGFEVSSSARDITLAMEYSIASKTFEDKINVTVVKMDLDVDSDNNNGFNQPARDENEDEIEDDDSKPGKYIMVNDDDNDDDGIPDFADGFNWDETNGNDDDLNSGEKFVPLVFELKPGIDATKAKIKFTYSDSDPAGVTRSGTAPNYTYTPAPGTLRIWTKDGNVSRNKASAKAATPGDFVEAGTYTAEQLGFSGTVGTKVFYVEAIAPSASLGATRILVEVDPYGGDDPERFILGDAVRMTAIKVEIKNPVNPNKGVSNDSDDYFFRGPEEDDVKVYYDFLPTDITATSVKLLIKEGGDTLREISLSTSPGANLLAEWDGKNASGDYYNKWDFRAVIEAVIGGVTFTSNEHVITDLLYKHRPLVYYDDEDELSGPQDVNCMMKHADLYIDKIINEKVDSAPLDFDDLRDANDATNRFQDLNDVYHQVNTESNTLYCRGTTASGHAFLQYWHFEPSSSVPGSNDVFHEGDWEMFQIAVEPNTAAEELQPIAITGSQHYYGQTIRWALVDPCDNGPGSVDQDYVGKSGHQPKVYVAVNSHATYFRQAGEINVDSWPPGSTANSGCQYDTGWSLKKDETGSQGYTYTLRIFHDPMISHWHGRWGEERWGIPPPYADSDDGPRSPIYRETAVEVWTHPREFNNYYLKLIDYSEPPDPNNRAHPETYIP